MTKSFGLFIILTALTLGMTACKSATNETTPVTLSSIAITTYPAQLCYAIGESFQVDGMAVAATYSDGTTLDVTNSVTLSGFDSSIATPSQTITCLYTESGNTKTATFTITISAAALSSIAITKQPAKTTYVVGNPFDATGLEVTATYANGTTRNVTSGVSIRGFDSGAAIASQTITCAYTEGVTTSTATFNIRIDEAVLSSIAITTQPSKTAYIVGDLLNTSGMVVTATYLNCEPRAVAGFTTSGFSGDASSALQQITVSYSENGITKTTTFDIKISVAIGQIYYTNGNVSSSYISGLTPAGIVCAVNENGSAKTILALTQAPSALAMAPSGTTGNDWIFKTSTTSGSGNWQVICAADPTGTRADSVATNYPAFNYCNNYNVSGFSSLTGWYLPSLSELLSVANEKSVINEGLRKVAGATLLGNDFFWSSSQINTHSINYLTYCVNFSTPNNGISTTRANTYTVRCVAGL
jgi:hypothetical protein